MSYLISIVVILLILADTAAACTVTVVGPRKAYRASSRIFLGEFLSFSGPSTSALPPKLATDWKMLEKARFRIERSWKGPSAGEADLYFSPICDCPMRQLVPKAGEKLLVFADKDGVIDACDMFVIEMGDDHRRDALKRIIERLDSFWFRTWATIYPL